MPKFPKGFSRRKSSGNAFEDVQPLPATEGTFKVFERPDGGSKSFDGGVKLSKATTNYLPPPPASRPRTSHREGNMFEGIMNGHRGSGASNSNTASTTDSSRLSAASTAPSSTASRNEEWKSPHDKSSNDVPAPRMPKTQSAFSLKAAGRSLSWGRNKQNTQTPTPPPPISKDLPHLPSPPPAEDEYQPRPRAVTSSSYASTATPPKLDDRDLGLSLGGDFSDMFSGFGKRKSQLLETEKKRATSRSPVGLPMALRSGQGLTSNQDFPPSGPASRTQSANRLNIPTPIHIDKNKDVEAAPYSWSTQHSNDGLMSNSSPPPFAPRNDENAPPVPQHSVPSRKPVNSQNGTARRPPLAESGVKRNSAYSGRRQSTLNLDDDEDAKLLRDSVLASRRLNATSYNPQVRESWALPSTSTYKVEDSAISGWTSSSVETTPKNQKATLPRDDSLFDDQILESANLAQKLANSAISPPKQGPTSKVMTPAQFERYRQDQERMRNVSGHSKDDDEEEDDTYEDEEDEAEKNRQVAKQRRKQEAHMAVYRQQMMKVTGETAATTPMSSGKSSSLGNRPSIYATQSSPSLSNIGLPEEGEEEDENVPLGVLLEHGFPNKNKPPMRTSGSNPNLRAQASAGPLPVFARHLPEDPYFGAGLVHPTPRESMSFGGGASSAYGGPARNAPPGGLIGVIATEERSRAMRRGSPNTQGEYGPPPANGFNGMGMSPNMMNGMGMPGMHPGDPMAAQMQQMHDIMTKQFHFMQQVMSQGGGPQNGQMNGQMNGQLQSPFIPPQDFQRPNSAHGVPGSSQLLRPGSSHQRAMSMLDPNSAPWMQQGAMQQGGMYAPSMHGQGGYTPSIAPSERSNVGLPGRYRPVSQMPQASDSKSRTSTMTGALGGWDAQTRQSTITTVKKEAEEDDDEEGWEEMKKKRQQKKSLWKSKAKKDSNNNGLKDLLGYTQ